MNFPFAQIFDIPVFNFINHTLSNKVFDLAMPVITYLGVSGLYVILGLLLLFSKKKEFKTLGLVLLAGLTVSYYSATILKVFVARPRPFMSLTNVILLSNTERTYSFPSNHAVTIFLVATLFTSHFKKYALFYSLAALVCFSRVYIGVHYPTDVLAGAVIGILIGWFLNHTLYAIRLPCRQAGSTQDEKSPRRPIG
jgi:undecaprenyl-diphosphatase